MTRIKLVGGVVAGVMLAAELAFFLLYVTGVLPHLMRVR